MAAAGGGVVFIPWYATGFRADAFAAALAQIAPVALRYGATEYGVYRSRDDRYRFLQTARFEDGVDFDRYWYGPEFSRFRGQHSSWYQVPVLHYWNDQVTAGAIEAEPVAGSPAQ
jgi:hypothetical protein